MRIPQSERVVHDDVLLAVLVEVSQPGVILVVGQDDRDLLRLTGEQVPPRRADEDVGVR